MSLRISGKAEPGDEIKSLLVKLACDGKRNLERLESDPKRRIHGLRVAMKKYRSVLKLTRRVLTKAKLRRLKRLATDLKNGLAGSRDDLVARETAARILGDNAGLPKPASATPAEPPQKLLKVAGKLIDSTKSIDLDGMERCRLKKGLKRTFKRLCRAVEQARESKAVDDFHTVRKRAKDLLYQASALRDCFAKAKKACRPAKELCSLLGEEHDLSITIDALPDLTEAQREQLKEGRTELRAKALREAAKL